MAQPDMQPHLGPTPQGHPGDEYHPGSANRPEPVTASTTRRQQGRQTAAPITASHRAPAPMMDGFSTSELPDAALAVGTARYGVAGSSPGTATVTRRHKTPAPVPATRSQSGTGSMTRVVHVAAPPTSTAPLWTALGVAVVCGGIAVWAFTEASSQNRVARDSRTERDQAAEELAALKIRAESQERRLAQVQVELAAERANTAREREITADMQRSVNKLGEELARIARTGGGADLSMVPSAAAVQAVTAPGAFPTPGIPTAGVPNTRKDKANAAR